MKNLYLTLVTQVDIRILTLSAYLILTD